MSSRRGDDVSVTSRPRPHLHLDVGVGQAVLGGQLAVVVNEVVEEGGAQDGLTRW